MLEDKPGIHRWIGVTAILFLIVVAYSDRINVAVLITNKEFLNHFGIAGNRFAQGQLMSVFVLFVGIASLAIAPLYETFMGVRSGFLLSVFLWAVFTLISPFTGAFFFLLILRAFLGMAEGPLMNLKTMYINEWFKDGERAKPNALGSAGLSLGAVVGVPLTTALVYGVNWHFSYYVIGLLNLLVGVPLVYFFVSKKRGPVYLEKQKGQEQQNELKGTAWQRLVKTVHLALLTPGIVWITIMQLFILSFNQGMQTWVPSYLLQERHFSIRAMGVLASLPFVAGVAGTLFGGLVTDLIPKKRMPSILIFGGLASAITLTCALSANMPPTTAILLILAQFFWGMQLPPIVTILQFTSDKRSIGSAYGVMNGVGNLLSALIPATMGALIGAYGRFAAGFLLIVGAEVMVAICATRLLVHRAFRHQADRDIALEERAGQAV